MRKQLAVAAGIVCLMLSVWACSKGPATYYPLGEGRTWKYQISAPTGSGEVQGEITASNLATRELKGKKVTPQKYEMQGGGRSIALSSIYIAEDANGIYIFAQQFPHDVEPKITSVPEYVLKKPVKVGSTWDTTLELGGGRSVPANATIASIDEVVDVPAGTFKDCVKVRIIGTDKGATGREAYRWFAPSVGLVKRIDPGGTMQLGSFTK